MAILKTMKPTTPTLLYANNSPEDILSNRDSGRAGIILEFKKISLEKIGLWSKIYENSLKIQWPFWNVWDIPHDCM